MSVSGVDCLSDGDACVVVAHDACHRNCDLIETLSPLADRRSPKCIRLLEMR